MNGIWEKVGQTPLVYLKTLSEKTGCHLWGKAEYSNPGGSIKDRAAKQIILEAEQSGVLRPGGTIVEGTAGNTGIGLATLGIPRGYKVVITMPNNQAKEKVETLERLGATVLQFPHCPFADQGHFYHQARQYAEKNQGVFWANQFENLANFRAHYQGTGPEILSQCTPQDKNDQGNNSQSHSHSHSQPHSPSNAKLDFFIASVGTGGTAGGVSRYLKEQRPGVKTVVADPYGSGIFEYLRSGQFKAEGGSITEGIGIMRLTENFKQAMIDESLRVSDHEMIDMLYYLRDQEGLVVGTSAALNVMAAVKVALAHRNSGKTLVTMLCDHGDRYRSKIFNSAWLEEKKLVPQKLNF